LQMLQLGWYLKRGQYQIEAAGCDAPMPTFERGSPKYLQQ
jgi:hypothetical protein